MARVFLFAAGTLASKLVEPECPTVPEIMVLQDSSGSLAAVHAAMSKDIGALLSDWALSYGTPVKLGFSSFTDKPLPLRGWGGRYATGWKDIDNCWDFGTAVTDDYGLVQEKFAEVEIRDGGDFAEAQFEALLYAARDKRTGFTDASIVNDDEGRLVTRIALIITDDVPHVAGDALAGIEHYNSPRQSDGYGGWGDSNFFAFQAAVWQNNSYPYTIEGYQQMSLLLLWEELGEDLYPDEVEELAQLKEAYGPSSWDQNVIPHDGVYTDDSCATKDYPTMEQIKEALDEANVLPVVLVTAPGLHMIDQSAQLACKDEFGYEYDDKTGRFKDPAVLVPCLIWHYTTAFEQAGINAVVGSFDSADDVVDAVKDIVIAASDYNCNLVHSTETPTEDPVITDAPTEAPTKPVTEAPTDKEEPTEAPTDAPTEGKTTTTTTEKAEDTTAEEPAKPTEPVPVPEEDEEGSNTAVIAGAAGGAVAGVAAIAALLYKQFGAGMFGSTPTAEMAVAEQVEAPDTRVEREGAEEVTMDMFQ